MTKKQAVKEYRQSLAITENHYPVKLDKVAIRCGWVDFVDMLAKEGRITEKQAQNWDNPFDQNN